MKCPIYLNFKFSLSFFYIFGEFIFLSIDYFLDKANSLLIKKKCWEEIDKENFFEKVFFSICHKIFLIFSIFLYLIYKLLSNSTIIKKNIISINMNKPNNSKPAVLNKRIEEIKKTKKYKITIYLTIILFFSIFFDCFQYFKKINLLYESIPFAFLSIIILNKYLVKDFYGKHQKYAIYLCVCVTIIFEFFFITHKVKKCETQEDKEHVFLLYIFNIVYFMFIGFKLIFLGYLHKTYFVNAYELFVFEGVGYFLIIFFDLIFCFLIYDLNHIKNKFGSNYVVKNNSYNHFLFYLCRNIVIFFITYFFYLIICLNNYNNYIISDIISKFIYFITYKYYRQITLGKNTRDDNNYYITFILNLIVFISSLLFNEIIIIKKYSFYRDTQIYLKDIEKKEINELNFTEIRNNILRDKSFD